MLRRKVIRRAYDHANPRSSGACLLPIPGTDFAADQGVFEKIATDGAARLG
ncbi:hypothetical protein ACWGDX_20215 [Streptomyces sp. NPDC055025]